MSASQRVHNAPTSAALWWCRAGPRCGGRCGVATGGHYRKPRAVDSVVVVPPGMRRSFFLARLSWDLSTGLVFQPGVIISLMIALALGLVEFEQFFPSPDLARFLAVEPGAVGGESDEVGELHEDFASMEPRTK